MTTLRWSTLSASRRAWLGLGGWTALCVVYVLAPGSLGLEVGYTVAVVAAAAFVTHRVIQWPARPPWTVLLCIGLWGMVLGEATWFGFEVRGIDPFPSAADALYLGGVICMIVGVFRLVHRLLGKRSRLAMVDAAIVTIAFGSVLWFFLIEPTLADAGLTWLERALSAGYPVLDVLAIAALSHLLMGGAGHNRGAALLTLAMTAFTVADIGFGALALQENYAVGGVFDGLLMFGIGAFSAAFAHPALRELERGVEPRQVYLGQRGQVVMASVAPLALAFADSDRLGARGEIGLLCVVAVFGLVITRMWQSFNADAEIGAIQQARRFEALAQHSGDFSIVIDRNRRITWASPSLGELAQVEVERLLGRDVLALLPLPTARAVEAQLARVMVDPHGHVRIGEHQWLETVVGAKTFQITATNLLDEDAVQGVLLVGRDTTEAKAMQDRLSHQALHDPLTDLPNRALFVERLKEVSARTGGARERFAAVILIDLDDFKEVNDSMGHAAGDAMLMGVSARLLQCIRPGDTVARFGGDEFAVLLADLDHHDQAAEVAERLLEVLQLPIQVAGVALPVPASGGIRFVGHGDAVDDILRDADIALYAAKAGSKGSCQVFLSPMLEKVTERVAVRTAMVGATDRGEFEVFFQPICTVADGRIVGLEALARWTRPDVGAVDPPEFIAVAEESGMIVELGLWILERAVRQMVEMEDQLRPDAYLSVNVSAIQLRDRTFVGQVRSILAQYGLAPTRLLLELTESVLSDSLSLSSLESLRSQGIRVAIDDFGTGYSSLAYLRDLPVDVVKIDQSFVQSASQPGRDDELVRGIVALARSLGLDAIAEGVETHEQLVELSKSGCPTAQGFHWCPPLPADELAVWIEGTKTFELDSGNDSSPT